MELSHKTSHFFSPSTSRERLNPISSSVFYSTAAKSHKPSQGHPLLLLENPKSSSVIMTDSANASDVGLPSHETSESPPPAKRTRLNLKGKTPTPSISTSPPANRLNKRRSVAAASSASTSVAGDALIFTPVIIPDVDPTQSARNSRASSIMSVMSASGPHTRSKKRKADQMASETPSVNGDPANQARTNPDVIVDIHAPAAPIALTAQKARVTVDSADEVNPDEEDEEQDLDQDLDQDDDQEKEEKVTVTRRGRPPGRGRGGGRGGRGGGRGGRAKGKGRKGKAKAKGRRVLTDMDFTEFFGFNRKRTSSNHKVQVAYDRQADLKYNYKEVARLVRNGLDILAEKSLDAVQDPLYYRMVPEFGQVMDDLDAKRDGVTTIFGKLFEMRLQHKIKERRLDTQYYQIQFECLVKDQVDREQALAKAVFLNMIKRSKPFLDENASVPPEEQANYRVIPEERPEMPSGEPADEDSMEAGAVSIRHTKRSSPKKRPAREAPADEPVAKRPSLLSAAALPAEQPEDDQPLVEGGAGPAPIKESALEHETPGIEEIDVNDNHQPLVYFPRYSRRGRYTDPNNRAVVRPHISFDSDEIGFRNIYAEAEGQPPLLKNFHLDVLSFDTPTGDSQNLADYKVGDFDMDLVKRHRLHPQYGIPIPGCRNPDNVVPRTDFKKPVPRTNPVTFLSSDGKTVYETSRSTTIIHALQDWSAYEKLSDMERAVHRYTPHELKMLNRFATFDAVAREADVAHLGADDLLQAAAVIEESSQAAKRLKTSAASTPATEHDTFVRRSYLPQGSSDPLHALADMAAYVSGETVKSSPAPAKSIPQTIAPVTTGFRSNYSPPKRTNHHTFSPWQGPGKKAKYSSGPMQASQQSIPPASTRPLPKRREPPLPVEPTTTHPIPPQPMGPQAMAPPSFVPQPAPLLRGSQQYMLPPSIAPLHMPPPRAPQSNLNPIRRLQVPGEATRGPQLARIQQTSNHPSATQTTTHPSATQASTYSSASQMGTYPSATQASTYSGAPQMGTHFSAQQGTTHSNSSRPATHASVPQGSLHSSSPRMAPYSSNPQGATYSNSPRVAMNSSALQGTTHSNSPGLTTNSSAPQGTTHSNSPGLATNSSAPQGTTPSNSPRVSARPSAPPGTPYSNSPQATIRPSATKVTTHLTAAPQQASPNSMAPPALPAAQNQPTGSQQMSPQLMSQQMMGPPQSLPDGAQSTFTRPRNGSGGQAMPPSPFFQGVSRHQQAVQQQNMQQQQQSSQQQNVQQQNMQQQQQSSQQQNVQQPAAVTPRSSRTGSLKTLAPRPDVSKNQGRGGPRQLQRAYDNPSPTQSFQGGERIYNYTTRDTYPQQQQVQQNTTQQAHTQEQRPSFNYAPSHPYQQGHPVGYPPPHIPKHQVPHPPQGQQYQGQIQQRQGQSPSQQFQHLPVQRQALPPPGQPSNQHYQLQTPQPGQSQSPAQSFQGLEHHQPQSPAPQAENRPERKSFGGVDGVDERETYTQPPLTQFRPINKHYPQPQGQQQHRSPYPATQSSAQNSGPQHGQQPGEHPSGRPQPSFNTPTPPLAPPSYGRNGPGPYRDFRN